MLAGLAVLASAAAHAQMPAALSTLVGARIAPGQWREYRNVGGGPLYDGRVTKVAYFETERLVNVDYQWIEFSSVDAKTRQVSRELVSLADPAEPPLRTLIYIDPPINPATLPGCDPLEHPKTRFKMSGHETVRVPAGTFPTTVFVYRSLGVEHKAYVSARDPKGIVMIETPTLRTELVAAGDGAASQRKGRPLYDGPAACPHRTQDAGKLAAMVDCLQERVVAAAALAGERDYDLVWQRTTRLCGINASAGVLGRLQSLLEPTFEAQWVAPRARRKER